MIRNSIHWFSQRFLSLVKLCRRLAAYPWFYPVVALVCLVYYTIRSFLMAHQLSSGLDESAYLFKGLLFATGKYAPFQPYGPLTNKMPLAFLIPGWVQVLFGPGLRTGRYFAILVSMLMLAGVWVTVKRLAGNGWATLTILALASNIFLVSLYSQAVSEGLVACALVWVIYLVVAPKRKLWQLIAGSLLTSVVVLIRQNLVPVCLFVPLYIAWQHGIRKTIYYLLVMLLPLAAIFILYWPEIFLVDWLPFIPRGFAFIDQFRASGVGTTSWSVTITPFIQIDSVFVAFNRVLLPIWGMLLSLVFWPKKTTFQQHPHRKAYLILTAFFWVVLVMHMYGNKAYCPYCFTNYTGFIIPVGYILATAMFLLLDRQAHPLRQATGVLLTLTFGMGLAFSFREKLAGLLSLQVPRITNLRLLPGTVDLWRMLSNKFSWSYDTLKIAVPIAAGLLVAILACILAVIFLLVAKKSLKSIGFSSMVCFMILILLLKPAVSRSRGILSAPCGDIIANNEAAARQLAEQIPAASKIYWDGGSSTVPLLYLQDPKIYPPQLNSVYTFRDGGDPDKVFRYGFWNQALADRWLAEADVVIVEGSSTNQRLINYVTSHDQELTPTIPISSCEKSSRLRIFIQNP